MARRVFLILFGLCAAGNAQQDIVARTLNKIRFAEQFIGIDIGAQVNAAFADFGASGRDQ